MLVFVTNDHVAGTTTWRHGRWRSRWRRTGGNLAGVTSTILIFWRRHHSVINVAACGVAAVLLREHSDLVAAWHSAWRLSNIQRLAAALRRQASSLGMALMRDMAGGVPATPASMPTLWR